MGLTAAQKVRRSLQELTLGRLLERLHLEQRVKTLRRRAAVAEPDQAGRADGA